MRRTPGLAPDSAKKEESSPGQSEQRFTTKAEYNRWLISQEKYSMAEDVRTQGRSGEDFIKERMKQHTQQGLSRQQAASVQMKKASEALEAHRERNLTKGRAVYEEVAGWRTGAKATKEEWVAYGKNVKEKTIKANATAESVAQLTDKKKKQAAATRADDEKKERERNELKDSIAKTAREQASKVRTETADEITDNAKRVFYEQRLAAAKETRSDAARWQKERKEDLTAFQESQNKKRAKGKAVREGAGKARQELLSTRTENASAMRSAKRQLADEHRQKMQDEYQARAATVKGVINNNFLVPGENQTGESAPGSPLEKSFYSLTNIRPPSPTIEPTSSD